MISLTLLILNFFGICAMAFFYERRISLLERKILEHDFTIHKHMRNK